MRDRTYMATRCDVCGKKIEPIKVKTPLGYFTVCNECGGEGGDDGDTDGTEDDNDGDT